MYDIDPSLLLNVPRLTVKGIAALSRALLAAKPELVPAEAEVALARVAERLEAFEQALIRLRRSIGLQTPALELALDQAADGLWVRFRGRLDDWAAYERPGFVAFADGETAKIDHAALLEQAKRAREIRARLLTLDGVSFLRLPYPEQAEVTRSILNLIDQDELGPEIDELVGDDVLPALRDMQVRYDAMVSRRAERSRSKEAADNLRLHQLGMQRALRRYAAAIYSLYDDDDPLSGERVFAALRPILSFRERAGNSGTGLADAEDELAEDELEIDALDDEAELDPDPASTVADAPGSTDGP